MQIGVDSARAVENKRIFVVDNDDVTGTALQFMLADEYETHVLSDTAGTIAKGRDFPPNLVIVGASLLETEGPTVVTKLKSELGGVKVLIVCLDADESIVKEALAAGAESTLVRPLKMEAVRRRVDAQLGRRAAIGIPVVQS
jgi:DNA-binding response OmpR family regulator